jgi:hypothetical protein
MKVAATPADPTAAPAALRTQPHFHTPGRPQRHAYMDGDAFYDALIEAHRGLADEASERLNARLVLLLANHIGDLHVLREALALARRGVAGAEAGPEGEPER